MLGHNIHQVFLVPLTVFGRSASLFILDFCVFVRVFPIAIKFFFFGRYLLARILDSKLDVCGFLEVSLLSALGFWLVLVFAVVVALVMLFVPLLLLWVL